jgi:hypothetical protein
MTILILFHQSHYRDWKRVLHRARLIPLARGLSWAGQL